MGKKNKGNAQAKSGGRGTNQDPAPQQTNLAEKQNTQTQSKARGK